MAHIWAFTEHPVSQAELKYQRYILETSRAGRVWIWLAYLMLIPAMLISITFLVMGAARWFDPSADTLLLNVLYGTLGIPLMYLVAMNLATYLVVSLITLGLAANSITREKENRTWDNLLLTNVDARHIVFGKWWATLRALIFDHSMLIILRIGIFVILVMEIERVFVTAKLPPTRIDDTPLNLIVVLLLMVAYAALDAAFTVALGVITPLLNLPGPVTLITILGSRVFVSLAMVAVPALVISAFAGHSSALYLVFAIAGLLLLTIMTWGILRIGQSLAVRLQLASPPQNVT
ncbi:MAG: hypothetical protein D6737_07225 [Chloroflexi bacterium]|nr:MAG: hypothetical protein D6737_07225 [Chloroflexota bacterium]